MVAAFMAALGVTVFALWWAIKSSLKDHPDE